MKYSIPRTGEVVIDLPDSSPIIDNHDLRLANLISKKRLPRIVDYHHRNLKFKNSYLYLQSSDFVSRIGVSLSTNEDTAMTLVGECTADNLEYLLERVGNVGMVSFMHHDHSEQSLTGPYRWIDLAKSKGLTELVLRYMPFIKVKNWLLNKMLGAAVYSTKEEVPNIAPKTAFGYLGNFTFMPGSKFGESGREDPFSLLDQELKREIVDFSKELTPELKDWYADLTVRVLERAKSHLCDPGMFDHVADDESMSFGHVFVGRYAVAGGNGTALMPGSIIGKRSIVGQGAIVRGYVPPNHLVVNNANYACYTIKQLAKMYDNGLLKSRDGKRLLY